MLLASLSDGYTRWVHVSTVGTFVGNCVIVRVQSQEGGLRQYPAGRRLRAASLDFIRFLIAVSKESESGWVRRQLATGPAHC